ncbi:hypothetical protein KEM54_005046 [Ascosphaera aggregata]|nr:hypothetical protein KEM54_005046 [Ascosphaera aggregata]
MPNHLESLQKDGFVVIPGLLPPDRLSTLKELATKVTTKTRKGEWPFFRTVPKQFPPWPKDYPPAAEGGIWGVQHLLHPDMEGREEFAQFYFSKDILSIVEELLGLDPAEKPDQELLVMELFNLLVAPEQRDFELRWHRDDIAETVTPEEEEKLLKKKSPGGRQSHAQYNLALCHDSSLIVIPGSHRRVRTEIERNADPFEPVLPGQLAVTLQPGDAVFYDSNILHRGVYKHKPESGEETRLTLHGSLGLKLIGERDEGEKSDVVRATAVLQHGVGLWVKNDNAGFEQYRKVNPRASAMRANLIAMGSGEGVGYSLEG